MKVAIAVPLAAVLAIFGTAAEGMGGLPYAEIIGNGGALVVLAWVVWYLISRQLPAERQARKETREDFRLTLDKVVERHDRWEEQRHEDSKRLNETLQSMQSNCAQSRTQMLQLAERAKKDD